MPLDSLLPKIGDRVKFKSAGDSRGVVVGYRVIVQWDEVGTSECSPESIEVSS